MGVWHTTGGAVQFAFTFVCKPARRHFYSYWPRFLLTVTNHCWATWVSIAAFKRCGPSSQRFISLLFLIKYEFWAKLHPTVYLRKIKCQKSCFGPVKSVQKNWAQRAYCILFFLSVRGLLISANQRGFAVSSVVCLWYAETLLPGTAAGSSPLSCSTHLGLSNIRLP